MKSLSQLFNDIKEARRNLQTFVDNAPRIMGVEAKQVVLENFAKQGYDTGNSFTKWVPRSLKTNAAYDRGRVKTFSGKLSKYRKGKNSTYKGSVFSSGKPLLEQTMTLYNSIDYRVSRRAVFIGVNESVVPYAKAHNEGLNHEPKRQYMPSTGQRPNQKMLDRIKRKLDIERDKALKKFKK